MVCSDALANGSIEGAVAMMIRLVDPMNKRRSCVAAGGIGAMTTRTIIGKEPFALLCNARKLRNADLGMGIAAAVQQPLDEGKAGYGCHGDRCGDSNEPERRARPRFPCRMLGPFPGLLGNRHR